MGKYIPAIITGLIVAFVFGFIMKVVGAEGFSAWFPPTSFGILTAYLMANLQGTKAGPKASDEQKAAALSLKPSPGKALIIAYRQGFVGKAAGLQVSLDGAVLAQIKSPQFTAKEVDPGPHSLGFTFVGLAASQNKQVVVGADVREGEVLAFRATLAMGAIKNTIAVEKIEDVSSLPPVLGKMKMVAPA